MTAPSLHPETASKRSSRRRQFGLKQLLMLFIGVSLVLAVGTQFGNVGILLATSLGIALLGAWLTWYSDRDAPLVLAILFAMLSFWLWPQISDPRRAGPTRTCQHNLRTLMLAIHCYSLDNNGNYPPAYIADANGRPMHSWRVLILPYLERGDLYEAYRFNEPWDSAHNLTVAQAIPSEYQCPQRPVGARGLFTSYVAIVGNETMWPGATSLTSPEITDGLSNTLCLLESPDSDVIWTEPRDFASDRIWLLTHPPAELPPWVSQHPRGLTCAMADGHIKTLRFRELTGRQVRALFTCAGDDDDDLEP